MSSDSSRANNTDGSVSSLPPTEQFMEDKPKKSEISILNSTSFTSKSVPDVPPSTPSNVITVGSKVCRICHANTVNERLISPCYCKGSMAYVHLSCLERWLNQSSRSYCELCKYHYNAEEKQRYGLCESIRLWVRHPRNRTHVQSDILISVLLTIVTVGLVSVCLMGMHYFVLEGKKMGISQNWARGIICFFLSVVVVGYFVTVYLLVKDQVVPWYTWWKNTVDVRLMLTESVTQGLRKPSRETTV